MTRLSQILEANKNSVFQPGRILRTPGPNCVLSQGQVPTCQTYVSHYSKTIMYSRVKPWNREEVHLINHAGAESFLVRLPLEYLLLNGP
jgi:hypothetical protein